MEDDVLIDEAAKLLPLVTKLMHTAMAGHPLAAGRSFTQKRALSHLHHGGGCSVSELSHAIGLSLPAASEMVDRLVDEGLVARTVNPADRRQVIVELTPAARKIGDEIHVIQRRQVRAAMSRLAPEERPIFVRSLQALADTLHESVGEWHQAACGQHAIPR